MEVLEPFAIHTDQLQTDSQSLSDVVPCLLNLEAHLQTTAVGIGKQLAKILLKSLQDRFTCVLNPLSDKFDATPAGACLMDPSVSLALLTPGMESLMKAAKSFVIQLTAEYNRKTAGAQEVYNSEVVTVGSQVPCLKDWVWHGAT